MKKTAFLLIFLFVTVFGGAVANAFDILTFDDFETGTLEEYSPSNADKCEIVKNNGNSYARINEKGVVMQKNFDSSAGTIAIDIDAYGEPDAVFRIVELYDSTGSTRAFALQSGYGKVFTKSENDADVRNPVDLTKWHHYQMIVNFETQSFDVYIDYVLLKSSLGFKASPANLGKIMIYADAVGGSFDNLRIAKINYGGIDNKILEIERILQTAEMGYAVGEYPESAFVMLRDSLSILTEKSSEENLSDEQLDEISTGLDEKIIDFNSRIIAVNEATSIFDDDFEDYEKDTPLPDKYTVKTNTMVRESGTEHFAALENSGSVARLIKKLDEPVSGVIEECFSFMQPDNICDIEQLWTVSDSSGRNIALKLYCEDGKMYLESATEDLVIMENLISDELYRMKIVLDTQNRSCAVFCNGDELVADCEFLGDCTEIGRLFEIRLNEEGALYIDDIDIKYPSVAERVNHIVFGEINSVIATGSINDGIEISAIGYDRFGVACQDADISFELLDSPDDVTLDGNILIVPKKTSGVITIKATAAEETYNILSLNAVDSGQITDLMIKAEDGKLSISGSVDNPNNYDVSLHIVGEYTDYSTLLELRMEDSQAVFEVNFPFAQNSKTEIFTVIFVGEGIYEKEETFRFFGYDAEEKFLQLINSAQENDVSTVLNDFKGYIALDAALLEKNGGEVYKAIADHADFASLSEFDTFLSELRALYAVMSASRETMQAAIENNITALKNHGLSSSFDSMTQKQKERFFIKAIGTDGASVDEICAQLNAIITEITKQASQSGGGSGGGISAGSGIGSKSGFAVTPISKAPAQENQTVIEFVDLKSAQWAHDAIMYLKAKGSLEGENNYVNPNNAITRAEMIKLLVCSFEITGDDAQPFSDSEGSWWSEYAQKARTAGIVSGFPDGSFGGDKLISREDAAVMISRVLQNKNITLYKQNKGEDFTDLLEISDYATRAVLDLQQHGIVSGIGYGLFAPKKNVTRAEAAQMIYNIIKI